jgi:hypothetical protein
MKVACVRIEGAMLFDCNAESRRSREKVRSELETGKSTPVEYGLEVWQNELPTPPMADEQKDSAFGSKQIRGWIHPRCCHLMSLRYWNCKMGES